MIGTFGRYQLLKRIGLGGMAEVYAARSHTLDGFEKDLVIKCMREDLTDDQEFVSMFIDEARISSSLSHPNIVQVFDFGQVGVTYYLAMEYVHGCDLQRVLQLPEVQARGLEAPLALLIMGETLKGLEYAHAKTGKGGEPLGVIHRDISPQNIMVSADGTVKLTDFGIAKVRGRANETQPRLLVGKLAYMAPEQAHAGAVLDKRADIFACGVVLWEMLAGRPMYVGTTDVLLKRVREASIPPLSGVRPDVPGALAELTMRALARDAAARYQSAREFGQAIHGALTHHFPNADNYALQEFMRNRRERLRIVDSSAWEGPEAAPLAPVTSAAAPAPPAAPVVPLPLAPALGEFIEAFRQSPSLWHLVKMAEVAAVAGQTEVALGFYQAAAAKFAQRGLLAQTLWCCRRMLGLRPLATLRPNIMALSTMAGQSDAELVRFFFPGDTPLELLLKDLFGGTAAGRLPHAAPTPLLASLDPDVFAALAEAAPLRVFEEGQTVIREGDFGDTMYLLGVGRVLVSVHDANARRIYLSSLTAGEFFGENSFFTASPRSATVEAADHVEAFEIGRALYDRLMSHNGRAGVVLLQFYKERIADALLAKSPIFGCLPAEARRALVARFEVRRFEAGSVIVAEGDTSDCVYIIKAGAAEISTARGGPRTVLNTIGPGTLFGEVAALRQIPRTAHVTATTEVEALELVAAEFHRVLDAWPDVRQRVLETLAQRARENLDKVMGPSPFARFNARA
jgi:CRP-like cAMP-binding protein